MRKRFLHIHGMNISVYESHGTETPSLFLLHGNSQDASVFSHQMDGDLGLRFHIVSIDLPGHGASSKASNPDRVCSMRGYTQVVKDVVRTLALGPTIFVGHSMGGHILIQSATDLPDLLGLLVFGTPPLRMPPRFDEAFLPDVTSGLTFKENLTDDDAKQWSKALILHPVPALTVHLEESIHHTDPRCRSSLGKNIAQGDFQDECVILQNLSVPVAVVLGEQDIFVNKEYCQSLPLPNLWNGGVQILSGCGHSPQLEIPESFNALLTEFALSCFMGKNR